MASNERCNQRFTGLTVKALIEALRALPPGATVYYSGEYAYEPVKELELIKEDEAVYCRKAGVYLT